MSNPFNKYNDLTGNGSNSNNSNEVYVGVSPFKVLGINPTKEQLGKIIGEEAASKFNTTYDIRQNYNKQEVRPLTIWVTDVDENVSPTIINYDLGKELVKSKNDKYQFFSADGKDSWAMDEQGLPNWVTGPFTKCTVGMKDWYSFIYKLVKWDSKVAEENGTTFFEYLKDVGLDVETIYDGNYQGLHGLVDYAEAKEFSVTGMFTAKVDHTENGERVRQRLLSRSDYIFYNYGNVTSKQLEAYKRKEEKQINSGYPLTNNGYFIQNAEKFDKDNSLPTLVKFNAAEHMKHVQSAGDNLDELLDL